MFAQWFGTGEDTGTAEADPPSAELHVQHLLQEFAVLFEYERLQEIVPQGLYIVPELDSVLTWHGVLFVRQGLYRGGVFKFILQLCDEYPEQASLPELFLISDVYHPLVEAHTGRVDVAALVPNWNEARDYASFVLPRLHRAFLFPDCPMAAARPPLNPAAHKLLLGDPAAFAGRASECASRSVRDACENHPDFSLRFDEGPADAHDRILGDFCKIDPSYSFEDRKTLFVNRFCEYYADAGSAGGKGATPSFDASFGKSDGGDAANKQAPGPA
mmetsp:Transcript_42858/g.121265  ORF Transcript_42858/g.121265 Transcript_42858/m.121265 type:complete len:273 (+) Transcript_42858:84-902(+)